MNVRLMKLALVFFIFVTLPIKLQSWIKYFNPDVQISVEQDSGSKLKNEQWNFEFNNEQWN